jgi:hypothetical protein
LVLAVQDTCEINFAPTKRRRGLGRGGHPTVVGYFAHPTLAVDASDGSLIGLAGLQLWTRAAAGESRGRRGAARERSAPPAKESQRWLSGARAGQAVLAGAERVVVVSDREGDIYSDMVQIPGERCAMLTRAAQNRTVDGEDRLFAAARAWAWSDERTIAIERHGGRAPRTARLRLRSGRVSIERPEGAAKSLPASVTMTLIEIREDAPPPGHDALHWYLLYSDAVANAQEAWEVARLYRLRWRIELAFKRLKSLVGLKGPPGSDERSARPYVLAHLLMILLLEPLVDAFEDSPRSAAAA